MSGDERRWQLPADLTAPRRARQLVREALAGGGLDDSARDVIELLVSELATNAVVHARPPHELVCRIDGEAVTIGVIDGSPEYPVLRNPDLTSDHGRGMLFVDRLADSWGVDADGDGKQVWFSASRAPGR